MIDELDNVELELEELPEEKPEPLVPRDYQQEGIDFLIAKKRAMLNDAPGLGKTLQAALAAKELSADGKQILVVGPTYLVEQWARFLAQQFPDDVVSVSRGGPLARIRALENAEAKWLIMNTEGLRTYYPPDTVDTVIFDEMHYLRNKDARMSKNAALLAARVDHIVGLTATPIYKDVGDLWHQLHLLDPNVWKAYQPFIELYAVQEFTRYGSNTIATRNRDLLDWWLSHFAFGRTYAEVGMQLPDMIEKDVVLDQTPDFAKRYRQLRDNYKAELTVEGDEAATATRYYENAAAVMHALRMMTLCAEKIQAIKDIVADRGGNENSPVVIFTWYRDSAEFLAEQFGVEAITGSIDATERASKAKAQRIRVATLASLSEGVDLSDARTVICAEEDYTPGRMYQAISRVRRWSHNNDPVLVYSVRMANTIDEVVHHAVKQRIGAAHRILREALEG